MITIPGLLDSHVHFRTPGEEYKEDWITGSAAALAGGVIGVVDMPTNVPPVLTASDLAAKDILIKPLAAIQYRLPIGVSDASLAATLAGQANACAIKVFLAPHATGMWVQHEDTLHELYAGAEKLLLIHAELGGHTRVDAIAAMKLIIELVTRYRKPTYFCHISTVEEVELITAAKAAGLPVYAEVTLHHLWLDEANTAQLGSKAKVNPPLRTAADRLALWQAIQDGIIDTIATDHAPHTVAEKSKPLAEAAAGFPAIELFLPLVYTGVARGYITMADMIRCCVDNPRRLFGFAESSAQLLVDDTATWVIGTEHIKSKAGWSPYIGMEVVGKIVSNSLY